MYKMITDKFLDVINILFRNINGLEKVEFLFLVNQIRFAFNIRQIIRIVADKLNLLPTSNTPQRNNVIRLIGHYPTVIGNTPKMSESTFGFLVKFVGIGNLCNRTYQALGRKFKRCLVRVVNFMMELKIVVTIYKFTPLLYKNSQLIELAIFFTYLLVVVELLALHQQRYQSRLLVVLLYDNLYLHLIAKNLNIYQKNLHQMQSILQMPFRIFSTCR